MASKEELKEDALILHRAWFPGKQEFVRAFTRRLVNSLARVAFPESLAFSNPSFHLPDNVSRFVLVFDSQNTTWRIVSHALYIIRTRVGFSARLP